jgi:hypothetical protein
MSKTRTTITEIEVEYRKSERYMLEGAIGYINHLIEEIRNGKFKTVEEVSEKLSRDGEAASGALSFHFARALKIAGLECGLLDLEEPAKKEAEKA